MKRTLQLVLSAYKRWISPALPNACRFVPTCSEYAMEAVERHGAIVGGVLACGRLLRCQPLARAGYDPVPQKVWGRMPNPVSRVTLSEESAAADSEAKDRYRQNRFSAV